MLLDHANRYLLSGRHEWMEQAGRAVFPFFALVLGMGLRGELSTRRAARLLSALAVLALLAHVAALPLVGAGVRGEALNALVTLAAGVLLVFGRQQQMIPGIGIMLLGAIGASFGEYGIIGAGLVYAVARQHTVAIWSLLVLLSVSQLTIVPLFVPLLWLLADGLCGEERMRSPRMLFGAGYVLQFGAFSAALWASAVGA